MRRIGWGSVALAGSLAGCGRSNADPQGPLDFWAMGREAEVVGELLGEFHARHPEVRVRVQQLPWTAAHEKLLTAYAGDALPDLCQLGNTWLPEFSALDALEPLDERMAAAGHSARRLLRRHPRHQPHADRRRREPASRPAVVRRHASALLSHRPAARRRPCRAAADVVRLARGDARHPCVTAGRSYGALLPLNEPDPLFALSLQQGPVLRDDDTRGAFSQPPFRRALDFYAGDLSRRPGAARWRARRSSNVWDEFAPRPVRVLRHRPLEHRRVPASPAGRRGKATGRPRRCPGPDGPGVSTAGGSSLVIFKSSPRKDAAWKLIRVPERARDDAALPRAHRRPAAAAQRLARAGARRRPAVAGVRAATRARARRAEDPRVGAYLPGDAAHGRARRAGAARRSEAACRELDARVDALLEKRRWLRTQARHDEARRRGLDPGRAGAAGDRRLLRAAGRRRPGAQPHRLRPLRARRPVDPALRRPATTTRGCCRRRCSGRRSATRFYFVVVGVPVSIGLSLGAALLLDSRFARWQALLSHLAVRAGGDDGRRGRRHLALPAAHALRPGQPGRWRRSASRRSTGSATRTGRCPRSSFRRLEELRLQHDHPAGGAAGGAARALRGGADRRRRRAAGASPT